MVGVPQAMRLRHGTAVRTTDQAFREAPVTRIYEASGDFAGMGSVLPDGQIRALKLLNPSKQPKIR